MDQFQIRPITPDDRFEVAELIYASINTWYRLRGFAQMFVGGPEVTEVFYDVYNDLTPGRAFVAENRRTGRLMGSCFYHPRPKHVSLGIMNVHPNYFGCGAGRALLQAIMDFTDASGYRQLRLTQSAVNLDSFSLYSKAGFVPRYSYQDMVLAVPSGGLKFSTPGMDRVRPATHADVPAMAALEEAVSGITRELDYRYTIDNQRGFWRTTVYENDAGGIDGFLISSGHPAMNLLGPCVARSEEAAAALVLREYDHHRGLTPMVLIPTDKQLLVRKMYEWGARNCELHFCQVRGEFQPFRGVNMPTFLPETA